MVYYVIMVESDNNYYITNSNFKDQQNITKTSFE